MNFDSKPCTDRQDYYFICIDNNYVSSPPRPAFYLYAGLKIASGLLILTINLEFKTPAKNVISDVVNVLKNIELIALLFVIFVLGEYN